MNQSADSKNANHLDAWMADHPWHPRLLPYVIYVALLPLIDMATDRWPDVYPILYSVQCLIVGWLLWRYRKLLPEMNLKFHWLAIPAGIAVCVIWIGLGRWMMHQFPQRFAVAADAPAHLFDRMSPTVQYASLGLRLLGMSLLVPVFEELFIRSLLLRSCHRFRQVMVGLVQWGQDLPVIGEWLMHKSIAKRADAHDQPFGRMFNQTPLGVISVTGVVLSTMAFTIGHAMRDWPGAVACSLIYIAVLRMTRDKGLGPVIWAHGLTNALLWGYCLYYSDWLFL
jgi:membrane protease YdiL (CAAX protease family)